MNSTSTDPLAQTQFGLDSIIATTQEQMLKTSADFAPVLTVTFGNTVEIIPMVELPTSQPEQFQVLYTAGQGLALRYQTQPVDYLYFVEIQSTTRVVVVSWQVASSTGTEVFLTMDRDKQGSVTAVTEEKRSNTDHPFSTYLMASLYTPLFQVFQPLLSELDHALVAYHPWWRSSAGLNHTLNNLHLLSQPIIALWFFLPQLTVFSVPPLALHLRHLITCINCSTYPKLTKEG